MRYNKKLAWLFCCFVVFVASAQNTQMKVGNNPYTLSSPTALLELESTNKGFLPPRMTSAAMNSISSPAQGLVVYCTDCTQGKGLYVYDGTTWVSVSAPTTSKVSAFVDQGTSVAFDNMLVRIPDSGNRSLQVLAVSGTMELKGSCQYISSGTPGGYLASLSAGSSFVYLDPSKTFLAVGDSSVCVLSDVSTKRSWQFSLIIGSGYNSNFISIEKL